MHAWRDPVFINSKTVSASDVFFMTKKRGTASRSRKVYLRHPEASDFDGIDGVLSQQPRTFSGVRFVGVSTAIAFDRIAEIVADSKRTNRS